MIKALKKLFEDSTTQTAPEDKSRAIKLASMALMFELAKADQTVDESELLTLQQAALKAFQVSPDELAELMTEAKQQARDATSLYEFTDLINQHCDEDAKFNVILSMWQLAYADQTIDRYEEHMIRKVAELIYVPHVQFLSAKEQARNQAR